MTGTDLLHMTVIESRSPEETYRIGSDLASKVPAGTVITLNGDLGAGKTLWTKGFAHGLGISELVTSPTFTILQEYTDGRIPLYHFDVYRIEDPDEMIETGFSDYLGGDGICVIEWAEMIREILPEERIDILLERDEKQGPEYRRITIKGV